MTVLWNGRGCAGGMFRGGLCSADGGSRWGAVRPSRLSEPFYVRARTSHTLAFSIQYYGASKNMGVAAKTLGFLKIRAQGLQILTGPYFFFLKLWSGGVHPGNFGRKNKCKCHETERSTIHHVTCFVSGVVRASAPLLHIAGTAY